MGRACPCPMELKAFSLFFFLGGNKLGPTIMLCSSQAPVIATSNAGGCRPEVTAGTPSVIVDGATGHCRRSVQVSSSIGLGIIADLSHPRPSLSNIDSRLLTTNRFQSRNKYTEFYVSIGRWCIDESRNAHHHDSCNSSRNHFPRNELAIIKSHMNSFNPFLNSVFFLFVTIQVLLRYSV